MSQQRLASRKLAGRFYVCTAGASCGVIFCLMLRRIAGRTYKRYFILCFANKKELTVQIQISGGTHLADCQIIIQLFQFHRDLRKSRVVVMEYITNIGFSEDIIFPDELRKAPRRKGETQVLLLFYTSISIPQVSRKTILN